jgi:hypothetical protein
MTINTKRFLLAATVAAFTASSPSGAQMTDLRPMVVGALAGSLRIQQPIPCGGEVDTTTPVTGGRLELTPSEGLTVPGGKRFTIVRGGITFAGFAASGSCLGITETRTYGEIAVRLDRAVTFTAAATSTPEVFAVSIPRAALEIESITLVNGEMETERKHPREDATGTIDLATGAMAIRVVLATEARFQALCTPLGCLIDETHVGTSTAQIAGTIAFPDTDADGVPDRADNCTLTSNPDQTPVPTPVINAPANVTLNSCVDRNFGIALGADACDARRVVVSSNAPGTFATGANVVTWTARDTSGRTATDTQTVTIADSTAPVFSFVPPAIAVHTCGPVALGTAVAADDCAGTPSITNNAPASFAVGTTMVTWTARDASGNAATAGQFVTVTDTVAPSVSCTPTRPTGNSYAVAAGDACATPAIRLGAFTLAAGEVVMINVTGRPGVRLVNTVAGIRHFQVGPGEDVITATDASGNTASAVCR